MKIVKLHILSLMVAALVAGDRAAAAPDEEKYKKTQQEARVEADKWRDDIKRSFILVEKSEVYLRAMQASTEKLRAFLVEKPCRDGAQAKEIESYIHGRFHTLYGKDIADIKHGVDLNCRDHKLAVTFWIAGFTPTAFLAELQNTRKSAQEIESATKRTFGNWATAVAPSLTDKSKTIEDIRASLMRASDQAKREIEQIPCSDRDAADRGTQANLEAATKELSENFTGYSLLIDCTGKKLSFFYAFLKLKRKGT
jgi:hypothetical protein